MKTSQFVYTSLSLVFIVLSVQLFADMPMPNPQEKSKMDNFIHLAKYAMQESAFQKLAVTDAAGAAKAFMDKKTQMRWRKITTNFSQEQIADFFTGAIVFRGTISNQGSVAGFYNPWWDTILLVWSHGLPDVPKINRFIFLAGEIFRRDSLATTPATSTIVPLTNPLVVEAAQKISSTKKYFESSFDTADKCSDYFPTYDADANEIIIQTRSALRLKLILMLLKNNRHYREAYAMCSLLAEGNPKRIKKLFPSANEAGFIRTYCGLNSMLRNDFVPYGYLPIKNGRMYLMINKAFPRLLVTMTLGSETDNSLEWYDLNESEKILQIWNSRKAVTK